PKGNYVNPVRVFACEAQPIVLEGLAKVLAGGSEFEYLGSTPGIADALDAVRHQHPDVLLVDQSVGLKQIFQFISDVKNTWPRCQPILWVNDLAEIDCFRALQLGARGILKKTVSIAAMRECLLAVGQGEVWIESSLAEHAVGAMDRRSSPRLTPREKDIVHHVCGGLKNKEIAEALAITPGTVKVHLMHIFEKTGVKDRFELAVQGRRLLGTEHASPLETVEDRTAKSFA
ncbi:MAG: response regulator transcription factor, partial [Acidobacteriota bacterium]|nr:response regulator transcription factor [Acidobacteriota bacterium]